MIRYPSSPSEIIVFFLISFYVFEMIQFIRLWLNWKESFSKKPSNIFFSVTAFVRPVFIFPIIYLYDVYILIRNLVLVTTKPLFPSLTCIFFYHLLLVSLDDLDCYILDENLRNQFVLERQKFVKKRRFVKFVILGFHLALVALYCIEIKLFKLQ